MIADQVPEVSILFIVIADFDQFTRKLTPTKLLEFLNEQFTRMDEIMTANGVTKIETVGEEYVAAVGVSPEDVEDGKANGHAKLLEKMFQAVSEILELQTAEVKFKMGVHSGSIVAGVVGNKLPRYRLVGDTINTAARQMQKGQVGTLQFGEETFNKLSPSLQGQMTYRGEVEMKGKGKVKAWSFSTTARRTTGAAKSTWSKLNIMNAMLKTPALERYNSTIMEVPDSDGEEEEPGKRASTFLSQRESRSEEVFEEIVHDDIEESSRDKSTIFDRIWGVEGGFTETMQEAWVKEFHATTTCKKLDKRTGKVAVAILIVSCLEAPYIYWLSSESEGDALNRLHNHVHAYMALRAGALLIMMCWWYSCGSAYMMPKIAASPNVAQTILTIYLRHSRHLRVWLVPLHHPKGAFRRCGWSTASSASNPDLRAELRYFLLRACSAM